MRTKGSCRFKPYFKIQTFRPEIGAWSDIKGTFMTATEARGKALSQNVKSRVREISMTGTRIL